MSTTATTVNGVEQGPEREVPSKLNVEGQNATDTDSATPALAANGSGTSDDDHEKKPAQGGGKGPAMEKYAYHCTSLRARTKTVL